MSRRQEGDVTAKYVLVIPDGAADEPFEALGGKTALQAAHPVGFREAAE